MILYPGPGNEASFCCSREWLTQEGDIENDTLNLAAYSTISNVAKGGDLEQVWQSLPKKSYYTVKLSTKVSSSLCQLI